MMDAKVAYKNEEGTQIKEDYENEDGTKYNGQMKIIIDENSEEFWVQHGKGT